MVGVRVLIALALACAASAMAACSSSSGSSGMPTKFACPSNSLMNQSASAACRSCSESNCGAEFSKTLGSGYASGDFGGGSCGSWVNCIAACPCNNPNCLTSCVPSDTCLTDLGTESTCTTQNCANQCSVGLGDGGAIVPDTD